VALVSKRFYALVTTPYAWRAAFLRYFAGQDSVAGHTKADQQAREEAESSDVIRSEVRYFTRLTALASWRSEYLLRTRLLRSVVRGKPGSVGSSARSSQSGKKATAVLTYNSKLPWMISHVHADFTGGKKGPRVIHGTRDLGVATVSDPTTGRVEKWGLDDPFAFQQLDEAFPDLEFFGVGEGPAAMPNVVDVSQPYGFAGGEGFPGGRVYYKATGQLRGHYIGHDHGMTEIPPEIPKIPALVDAVSCVWIAKSSSVTSTTQSMVGILAGSTLGVVTSYALGHESTGPRFGDGDMTARWVLSPGVPIIDIKVDDQYSLRRKTLGRVWAVALNALGEVYYLTEPPSPPFHKGKAEDAIKDAWHAGRTAHWELIEATRRTAKPDEFDKNAVMGTYSPRSSAHAMNLSREQVVAEAREIEKHFKHTPAHFRKVCQGWDMLRKLEVDFAAGGENGGGESIFVITCGSEEAEPASIRRFVKCSGSTKPTPSGAVTPVAPPVAPRQSIFGGEAVVEISKATLQVDSNTNGVSPSASGSSTPRLGSIPGKVEIEEWRANEFVFKHNHAVEITASAVDTSTFALMTDFEDPLLSGSSGSNTPGTPTSKHATGEIPGRRARLLAVGTNTGSVIVWNMRDTTSPTVSPVRVIHTDSPEVTALAVSALYIVHGGSDSLVQAWDPLASSLEPIRTLNAKSSGRIPRHILHANPALQHANYFAVRAIALDPNATILRGVLAFGTFVRFWTYSSTAQGSSRKRRLRHSDIHGRLAGRRNNGTVSSYIAAEEAELRHEREHRSREVDRLRKRFGVGLAELTEEEALQYATMVSAESFAADEMRRNTSASDTTAGETASSVGSSALAEGAFVTPEPSVSNGGGGVVNLPVLRGEGVAAAAAVDTADAGGGGEDDDYEAQIQRAIRLSLLEGVGGDMSPSQQSSPPSQSPSQSWGGGTTAATAATPWSEYEVRVQVKSAKGKGKGKGRSEHVSPEGAGVGGSALGVSGDAAGGSGVSPDIGVDADDDLALALRLSMEEEEARLRRVKEQEEAEAADVAWEGDEYPPLEVKGKGKGKWV
jgi:WD40 repeat protein